MLGPKANVVFDGSLIQTYLLVCESLLGSEWGQRDVLLVLKEEAKYPTKCSMLQTVVLHNRDFV